jgi:hypothetical protein
VVLVDLSGTGEMISSNSVSQDMIAKLHTLSRAELWLGRRMLGEWAKELGVVVEFLNTKYQAKEIVLDGTMEAGLAGLLLSTFENRNISEIILRNAPVTYMIDTREGIDFFSMAIHLPGILRWGDISLMAALSSKNVTFIDPVTMSGHRLQEESLEPWLTEFDKVRQMSRQTGRTVFVYSR